jgi:alkylation response protein AidB-like acyl-CoA dehydrogenase
MPTYQAPLRDIRFVFHELLDAGDQLRALPGFEEVDDDTVDAILEEAGKVCEELLAPLNRPGDEQGCRLGDGAEVSTPDGFPEAYREYAEGGWTALACDPEFGGQGLPETLGFILDELLSGSNVSFSLYPGLTRGAYSALHAHASDELKARFLPKMVEGTWTGTMCLTESQAGTDLGLVRTRAEPRDDGSYAVTGTKIFITGGDQDLSDNIVHLVLARLPDAPPGIGGISLFLVPKFLPGADGEPGERNAVGCGALEQKMGIKASATCVMNFDGATGWLVGPPNKGVACMFTMMNAERLAVGIQGLGLADVAYQNAVAYARERVQGRALTGPKDPDQAADTILVHPDVRRMLLTARAYSEGCRALSVWTALQIDAAERHPDTEAREVADDLVQLVTPVVKAAFTDLGYESATLCQQVLGGHGYIREWGMEQFVRDVRIAQIYEGTNGVQALDLVRRKLALHGGRLTGRLFGLMRAWFDERGSMPGRADYAGPAAEALARLEGVTTWLAERAGGDPDELGAASVDYLRLFALTVLAWFWARMADVALDNVDGDDAAFYTAKLATARFYMSRLLPQTLALEQSVRAGAAPLMALDEAAF